MYMAHNFDSISIGWLIILKMLILFEMAGLMASATLKASFEQQLLFRKWFKAKSEENQSKRKGNAEQ